MAIVSCWNNFVEMQTSELEVKKDNRNDWFLVAKYGPSLDLRQLQSYDVGLNNIFDRAQKAFPSISINPSIMSGAPCISHTRIPVYMVLQALKDHGSIEGVKKSYSKLTSDQIVNAVEFAQYVMECPIEREHSTAG